MSHDPAISFLSIFPKETCMGAQGDMYMDVQLFIIMKNWEQLMYTNCASELYIYIFFFTIVY